jgi:hypothetical protein
MCVSHAKNENLFIIFNKIDDEMRLEWLYAHRRVHFTTRARHARMVGDQGYQREKFLVISHCLSLAEGEDAIFGNTDDVFFRLSGKTEAHDQRTLP